MENGWEYSWLKCLFSKLSLGELQERQYMFDILYTINSDAIAELVKETRRKWGLAEEKDTQQLIDMTPDYWSEIFRLVKIKDMKNSHC